MSLKDAAEEFIYKFKEMAEALDYQSNERLSYEVMRLEDELNRIKSYVASLKQEHKELQTKHAQLALKYGELLNENISANVVHALTKKPIS